MADSLEQVNEANAFAASQRLREQSLGPLDLATLDIQDAHEIRLLLRGDSVIDWHRLAVQTPEQVRRLLALNAFDIDDPNDLRRLEDLRERASRYVTEVLGLKIDDAAVKGTPVPELPILASGDGRAARHACTMLKVMHIIHHLDARELLTALSLPINELFSRVEQSVARMFETLRDAGVPVAEFAWSRKTRNSLVTKLLVKRETSAARVFDRLRFRLVVERPQDILPALHMMLHRCIPFNYVVPGQTMNSLVDTQAVEHRIPPESDFSMPLDEETPIPNEFSGQEYRVLNFIADLPVRVDGIVGEADREKLLERGRVVFVLAEFQVLDRETDRNNEDGDNSHRQYKQRQHQRVRERLLREPKRNGSGNTNSHPRVSASPEPAGEGE